MNNPSKNTLIMFAVFIITALTNYSYNIAMGWLLTPEQYGTLGVSISFLLILSLFTSNAFPLTVSKFISAKYDLNTKHKIFKSSLVANLCFAFIITSLFYTAYQVQLINLEEKYNLYISVVIFAILVSSIAIIYSSLLQGTFRFKAYGLIGVVGTLTKLISGVGFVVLGFGALGALFAIPLGTLVALLINLVLARDFKFWKTKGFADLSMYFFAIPTFFVTLSMTLLMNMDLLGVKFLTLSDLESGYYRAVLILAQLPLFVAGSIVSVMFPYISRHGTENNKYAEKTIKYTVLFILPVSLSIAIIPKSFIALLFPKEYMVGADALRVIAIGIGFLVIIQVLTYIFQARHKPRIPAIVLMCAVVVSGIALYSLIPRYGIVGAATSTTIACAFGLTGLSYAYKPKVKIAEVIKTLIAYAVFGFFIYLIPHYSRVLTLVDLGVSGMVYLVALLVLGLVREEDVRIILSGVLPEDTINKVLKLV